MPILPENPFKGRQYPGDVILLAVRWYLRDQSQAFLPFGDNYFFLFE